MDELVESDLFSEIRIVAPREELSIHPILHEPLVGPDDERDDD
jgi:hypothetical protein